MKMFLVICLALVCASGFSEEKGAPAAGAFGFTGTIQTGTDADEVTPGTNLFFNPRVGIGFHYHLLSALMLEWRAYLSYDDFQLSTGPTQYLQGGGAAGIYYWVNVDDDFSLFVGPQLAAYINDLLHFDTRSISHTQLAVYFGLQYSFSRHFAVFGDFGCGLYDISDNSGASWQGLMYFKVILPEIGFVFYL